MYFFKTITEHAKFAQTAFRNQSSTKRMISGAFLASLAAVLQSAGGMPGVGYVISPLATLPILICTIFSFSIGITSYFVAILLLLILQPSELFVFPFTTGLIGLSIGVGFHFLKKRLHIIFMSAIMLAIGINFLLYIIRFPVLGPTISDSFSYVTIGSIFIFTFLYSWLWVEIAQQLIKRIVNAIPS